MFQAESCPEVGMSLRGTAHMHQGQAGNPKTQATRTHRIDRWNDAMSRVHDDGFPGQCSHMHLLISNTRLRGRSALTHAQELFLHRSGSHNICWHNNSKHKFTRIESAQPWGGIARNPRPERKAVEKLHAYKSYRCYPFLVYPPFWSDRGENEDNSNSGQV